MTPADLARLHARCFRSPPPWSQGDFAGLLAQPQVHLLSTPDGQGFALIRTIADEAEVLTIATDPAARRQGVARDLMARAEDAAARAGAVAMFLEVAADNAPACALYAACGFVPVGRRRGYYRAGDGAPVDALVLRKAIGQEFSAPHGQP